MIGLFGVNILTDPLIVEPPEEIPVVKRKEFVEVPDTNDDLEDLTHMRNIGFYNSKYYFVGSGSGGNPYILSASSLIAASVEEQLIAGIVSTARFRCCRVWDNDIYGLATDGTVTYWAYTTDGGANWDTDSKVYQAPGIIDIIRFSDGTTYLFVSDTTGGGNFAYFEQLNGVNVDSVEVDAYEQVYAGYTDFTTDIYYFLYRDTSSNLIKAALTKATGNITIIETLTGILEPTTYRLNAQQYWNFGNIEILMDVDHFYVRENSGNWESFSDVGTTTNGIVWGLDKDENLVPLFIIWKDSIYAVNPQGTPSKMQVFTDDAFVGWLDWICNGADKIYQTAWIVAMA